MSKKTARFANIGNVKKSTNNLVDQALKQQEEWLNNKRKSGTTSLLPAVTNSSDKDDIRIAAAESHEKKVVKKMNANNKKRNVLKSYWFPILCAIAVVLMILYMVLVPGYREKNNNVPIVPEPVVNAIEHIETPTFDIVRISDKGQLTIAGRWKPMTSVSIIVNKEIIATELTNVRGEFAHSSSREFDAGNYTIRLLGVEEDIKSTQDVFVYIAPRGTGSSMSLLMTKDGSRMLQVPSMTDGDLVISKIDYLANGRIMVQGKALPRLRVSLAIDGKELGFVRVSDHKNFGLGADVQPLTAGVEYELSVKLHDGDGNIAAWFDHKFTMPEMTPGDETYYTVRRGDALWIIARNFFGRGVLYSLIVEKNSISNPDLIFPKQILQIPIK